MRIQFGQMAIGLAVAALALAACQKSATVSDAPDSIFYNAVITTGIDGAPNAQAVSVKAGRIMAVGANEDLMKTAGPATEVVDLSGVHLYPGFTDAHAHLRGIGEREMTLDLDEVKSLAELVDTVKKAAEALPPGAVLHGRGWIETHWPEKRFPNRQDLDSVTGDHPVILERADGHALVANTKALEKAGLAGRPEGQPDGGRIETDATGMPTGMLIDNAMAPMAALASAPTPEYLDDAYAKGSEREVALGWTGVHNMSAAAADVPRMAALSATGKLKLRVYNAVDGASAGEFPKDLFFTTPDGLVTTKAIKLYMDGALGSRGALLFTPYADRPDTTGLAIARETETLAQLKTAYDAGIQVAFHAIGDRGNATVLDWMEKTFDTVPADERAKRDPRWRIEHSQIVRVEDIPRFAKSGIIPSMQPSHAIGDLYFAPARLGSARLGGAYAWRALIDSGSIIAGGSDAPVEQGDPRIEFYAAVARKDLKGASGAAAEWHPEQAVTRAEALKMFTLWPAIASFREKDLGTIEPGKLADFTGFSGDLMTVSEQEILTLAPAITVINGKVAWTR